ncbi:MAG TPA: transcriptional regulator [Steroidobacteraceae bacterium]|jgi:DNA-binding MarR family transcriptional regulator|nr:transcriptional regulator [Steroidobacteraceae bacterium]
MAGKSSAVKRGEGLSGARAPARPAPVETARAAVKATPIRMHAGSEDAGLDRLIYERVRLGIMSALAMNEQLTFNELKTLFDVSDGNLSAHARKLEEAGYVACTKSFEARRPKSVYRITPVGKKALLRYLEHIEAVIKATRHS